MPFKNIFFLVLVLISTQSFCAEISYRSADGTLNKLNKFYFLVSNNDDAKKIDIGFRGLIQKKTKDKFLKNIFINVKEENDKYWIIIQSIFSFTIEELQKMAKSQNADCQEIKITNC